MQPTPVSTSKQPLLPKEEPQPEEQVQQQQPEKKAEETHDVIKIPKVPAGQAAELSAFRDQCAAGVCFVRL